MSNRRKIKQIEPQAVTLGEIAAHAGIPGGAVWESIAGLFGRGALRPAYRFPDETTTAAAVNICDAGELVMRVKDHGDYMFMIFPMPPWEALPEERLNMLMLFAEHGPKDLATLAMYYASLRTGQVDGEGNLITDSDKMEDYLYCPRGWLRG